MLACGLEDPQTEQPQHGHQREVARVWRLAGGGEQGPGLQAGEPQGRWPGGHRRAADVLGGRVFQHAVEDAGPVEPGHDENLREMVEGLNRRISCIHTMDSSRCGPLCG
jgi:hypothetical protein